MIIPAKYNIDIGRGVTLLPIVLKCKDMDGVVVPLTGWKVFADVRKTPAGDLQFSFSPVITNEAEGEITISMTDEQTATLKDGIYGWDLLLESPSGEVHGPFISGRVKVTTPYTQP